ncbi:MAG: RNA methyltransferase [archaeon]
MVSVVLVEPENPGNIGAVARVMKNFDFDELILIAPKADHLCDEAICRAKHAGDVLKKAIVMPYSYFEKGINSLFSDFKIVAATTSVLGSDYNIPRLPISPEALAKNITAKTAIVFGREGSGLNNDEISRCSFIVTIPSSKKYPALNLSHSVSIILYEIYKLNGKNKIGSNINYISQKEKEVILEKVELLLDSLHFATPEKKETQREVWRSIVNKNFLTKREAFALLGFLRKLDRKKSEK